MRVDLDPFVKDAKCGAVSTTGIAFAKLDFGIEITIDAADPTSDHPIHMAIIISVRVPVGLRNCIPGRIPGAERPRAAAEGPIGIGGVEISVWIVDAIGVGCLIIDTVVPPIGALRPRGAPVSHAVCHCRLRRRSSENLSRDEGTIRAVAVKTIRAKGVERKLDLVADEYTWNRNKYINTDAIVEGHGPRE